MSKVFDVVAYTRDAHPANHCSFVQQGGCWPTHCVRGQPGFEFAPEIPILPDALIIDKATEPDYDSFSGFDRTELARRLRDRRIKRVVIGGLATDYCVKATALDAVREGLETWALVDAIAPVNVKPGDEARALLELRDAGVTLSDSGQIVNILQSHHEPTALVVVDMQRDFCPGGALAVSAAPRAYAPLAKLLAMAGTGS